MADERLSLLEDGRYLCVCAYKTSRLSPILCLPKHTKHFKSDSSARSAPDPRPCFPGLFFLVFRSQQRFLALLGVPIVPQSLSNAEHRQAHKMRIFKSAGDRLRVELEQCDSAKLRPEFPFSGSLEISDVIKLEDWPSCGSIRPGDLERSFVGCSHRYFEGCKPHSVRLENVALPPRILDSIAIDIRKIESVTCSKADLRRLVSLDQIVAQVHESKRVCTMAQARTLVTEVEERLGGFQFEWRQWDGRIFLSNSDGSHRFSGARYLARKFNEPIILHGELKEWRLNPLVVANLVERFFIVLASNNWVVRSALCTASIDHVQGELKIGRPHNCILLPKDKKTSKQAMEILLEKGAVEMSSTFESYLTNQLSVGSP